MKKIFILSLFLLNFLIFAQTPTAKFSIAQGTNTIGSHEIVFTDESLGTPTSYLWEFSSGGNVISSTLQNPSVIYNKLGDYSVKLTVTNASGSSFLSTNFTIGNKLDLSTGKNDDGSLMSINAEEDLDWNYVKEGSGLPSVHPKTRETYTGWGFAQITNSLKNSVWISGDGLGTGYYNYTSKNFIVNHGDEAYLSLRSLSFVRNWTYLVKDNNDGTFTESEITKTDWLSDGAKGWLNSRSPLVDKISVNPGNYNLKVKVYSNNNDLRESADVNAILWYGSGFSVLPFAKISSDSKSVNLGTPINFSSQSLNLKKLIVPVSYAWEFQDGTNIITSNLENPTVTFTQPGTHDVKLTINYNDEQSSTVSVDNFVETVSTVLSTEELSKNKITLYPNPAADFVMISGNIELEYSVYSLNGQLLKSGKSSNKKIDLRDLKKGNYIVKLNNQKAIQIIKK